MKKSNSDLDYFDGEKFLNLHPPKLIKHSYWDLIKWRFTQKSSPWPAWVENLPHAPLAERVEGHSFVVSFINHATVLIQIAGLNILTDPIWSARCSPIPWLGPKRVHAPGIMMKELPPIDYVLISHDHYDHLDLRTVNQLHEQFKPNFYSGLDVSKYLYAKNKTINAVDMQWWQSLPLKNDVSITFTPAQHWSRRNLVEFNQTLWGGFALTTPKHTIYFSGDSGFGPHFKQIAEKFPNITLAILPIGAYEPRWFMEHAHINPEEAVQVHKILKAKHSLGIHFNTFKLSDEGYNRPLIDLKIAMNRNGINPQEFLTLLPGKSWQIK